MQLKIKASFKIKGSVKKRKNAIKFFLTYADNWHAYANDYETVNLISYLVNLQILNHNQFNQVKVNSHNAKLYLGA